VCGAGCNWGLLQADFKQEFQRKFPDFYHILIGHQNVERSFFLS
jgi:hypothetical protein